MNLAEGTTCACSFQNTSEKQNRTSSVEKGIKNIRNAKKGACGDTARAPKCVERSTTLLENNSVPGSSRAAGGAKTREANT